MNLKEKIITEIKKIYDPEIPVNIYELGLIYDIKVDDNNVEVKMTLTSPNCPVAESLPKEVKDSILKIKDDEKTKLMSLGGVKNYPMRVKCATLSWHALSSALEDFQKEVSTE